MDRLQPHVDAQGIYIRYARHGVADGITYYMIPAQEVGEIHRPAGCYALQLRAFKHQIASLPPAEQARAVTYEKSAIRQEHGPRPGIVLRTSGDGSTGGSYIPLDHLHARAFGNGGGGNDQITKTALLLPNLVASVTARYPRQTYPGVVKHAVTVTKAVIDNLVIFVFRGAWDPPKLTFRSSTGAVLWRSP